MLQENDVTLTGLNGQEPQEVREAPPAEAVAANPTPPADEAVRPVKGERNGTGHEPLSPRHVEAGRKGARRIHQLIQEGKLYEQEHGLKRGRQRIRQLIEEGKLYEQEHGLVPAGRKVRGSRPARMSREKALQQFFTALVRLTKPAVRKELVRLLQALDGETSGR